ncbi:transglycosylase domain-containing protein [Prevotella sp. E15-22]|uniref:transglycosylase domain-containing protein n=1 Tax=Prevotella sp. E15-22 TaxID=2937774 RepID=UPI0020628654|nr:transglycosylase domain-containing protein [Prevotella sp. E15-22]UPS45617.1 transglycosylase domain-containing protein [Prevotella sp. E15-22]
MKKLKPFIDKSCQALKNACKWYISIFKGRPWYIKLLSSLATFIVVILLYLIAVDINLLWLFGKSPSMSTIVNTRPAQASEIYSADSVMIGKFFSENRTPVKYEDVNPIFWEALIDTEDERFYKHFGVDFQAFGAALKDYVVHHDARGASTITQQLAKNLFRVRTEYSTGLLGNIPGIKMLIMKTKEWITATKLEMNFSKEEILTMYANTVDFGSNAFGIKTACKTYFGTTPKDLTPDQAAILVGMLKATTYYNPRINPENSLSRRNVVLGNMLNRGHLTKEEYNSLKALPITLDYSVENAYDGQATYFREAVKDYLSDWCNENGYDLYTDGLKIYTTIDTRMQKYAEEAAWEQMEQLQKKFNNHWGNVNPWQDERHQEIPNFIENIAKRQPVYKYLEKHFNGNKDSIDYYLNLPHPVKLFSYNGTYETEMSTLDSIRYMEHFMHCGFVAIEPQTGHVKAWVGDLDFNTWKYDKVTAMRQPGSTFKLFVYTEAMNQGLTPCDRRMDSFFSMKVWDNEKKKEVIWAPTNANGYFTDYNMTLKSAFAQSINSVAVRVGQEVGIDRIIETAHKMGIKSPLHNTPSLALGASDVNLEELVNAYATVANNGRSHATILVTRILDRDGNEIYKSHEEDDEAIPYRSAFYMQQMLMAGMREPGGTSMNMWRYVRNYTDTDFGGKTGTSNNHSDAWFVGVTPRLVCGAWVGGEYRAIHFRTGELGQGSRTALPICGQFFESVLGDTKFRHYHARFANPQDASILSADYQCAGYYVDPNDSIDEAATDSIIDGENTNTPDTNLMEQDSENSSDE